LIAIGLVVISNESDACELFGRRDVGGEDQEGAFLAFALRAAHLKE